MPVAQNSDGTTTFITEPRHKFIAASIFMATTVGVIAFISGIASGGAAPIIFGLLITVAGIVAWVKTHLGKVWNGLPGDDKAFAMPGVVIGSAIAISVIPITLFCIAVLKGVNVRNAVS
jgi:ACR3 family arsenite efflux pump ArsB